MHSQRLLFYFDWFLFLTLVGMLLITGVGVGTIFGGDAPLASAAYWKARAATAIAIQKPESPPIVPMPLKLEADRRPVVWLYSAVWCAPCAAVKADASKFPFVLKVWDIDKQTPPIPIQSIPVLHWNGSDGKGYRYPPPDHEGKIASYPGAEEFVRIWQGTQREQSSRKNHGTESKPPPE